MANLVKNDPEKARKYFEDKMSFTTGPKELEDALEQGNVVAVDVRAKKDFDEGHIPGSINLPKDAWSTERGLQKDKLHVVLCYFQQCHLAAQACVELAKLGYSVMELEGGFEAWKEHDGAIEKGESAQPEDAVGRARAFLEEKREVEGKMPLAPPKVTAARKNEEQAEEEKPSPKGEAKEGEAARAAAEGKKDADAHADPDADADAEADAHADADADADAHADAEADAHADADADDSTKPSKGDGRDPRTEEPAPTSIH